MYDSNVWPNKRDTEMFVVIPAGLNTKHYYVVQQLLLFLKIHIKYDTEHKENTLNILLKL